MATLSNSAVDQLGIRASEMAAKAAATKMTQDRPDLLQRIRDEDSLATIFCRILNRHAAEAVLGAFDDAKEALEAMPGAFALAEATFAASMVIAGVAAAQQFIAEEDVAKARGL